MTIEQSAVDMTEALRKAKVPHMIVGGLSSNFYGIPRNTKDVDIVIELRHSKQLAEVASHLPDCFKFDSQVTFETITGSVRHIVKIVGTPFVIELFELATDDFQKSRFERRKEIFVPQLNASVSIPTAEDVVIQKLRWARPKDLEDARDVMAVQGEALNREYIADWCRKLGILERYETLVASVPDI